MNFKKIVARTKNFIQSSSLTAINFENFIDEYLIYSSNFHSPKTTKDIKITLNKLALQLNNPLIHDISIKEVQLFLRQQLKVSIYSHNKYLRYLKAFFNYAVQQNYILENPCKKLKQIPTPERQPLYFTDPEFEKLLGVIDDIDLQELVLIARLTGCRESELIKMVWEQVDFEQGLIILNNHNHTTKSKRVRSVPLSTDAFKILSNRKERANLNYVFTYKGKPIDQYFISKKFKKYVIKAGLNPKFRFHDLRHTFGSLLVQRGASIFSIQKLLGHANIKTTQIYLHLSPRDLVHAVQKLDFNSFNRTEGAVL
ncbi:MAG: hypothetical protein FJW56_01090 [Actinobacteria bacterium]|nr:hypothetical protein [Actinomycetota bacterium]